MQEEYVVEIGKVRSAIDRFFGTSGGWVYNTVNIPNPEDPEGPWIPTEECTDAPNIFGEMGRLGIILCGGALTSTFTGAKINDLDFYCKSEKDLKAALEFLNSYFPIQHITTANAVTLKRRSANRVYTIQLITRFSGEPLNIFNKFDFTITNGCYDASSNSLILGPRFLPDLAARKLIYSGHSEFPICAMYRTKKFQERGFKLPGSTVMHIAMCIVQLEIKTYAQLKEQLMGIDTMFLGPLLESKDPGMEVDVGEFIVEAFKRLRINGNTEAEDFEEEFDE